MTLVSHGRWRYSLSDLLALTAIVGFGCVWVTWPRRSAEQFVVEYFGELDVIANPFKEGTPEATAFEKNYQPKQRELKIVSHKRTTMDLLVGRQTLIARCTNSPSVGGPWSLAQHSTGIALTAATASDWTNWP